MLLIKTALVIFIAAVSLSVVRVEIEEHAPRWRLVAESVLYLLLCGMGVVGL